MSSNTKKTILVLAANPKGTKPLRLDEEVREIDAGLRRARNREQFVLEQKWAVRPRDIHRAMLDINPSIVHFSGHGTGDEGLVFEDETGATKLVNGEALAGLFELFAEQVECVVLNGCYSEVQATAIARHVNYVIGMNKEIGDRAAIEFAVGFYDALGAGRPVEFAHKFGCAAIRLSGIPEHLTPVLKKKPGIGKTIATLRQPEDQPLKDETMSETSDQAIKVFFSYAHEDENLRDELAKHLKLFQRQGVITAWHDREISAGTEWAGHIDEHLNTAQIILLLISADFLASDYCYDIELTRAMERHAAQEARVIPVILREVDWRGAPFGKLQALPQNAEPVTKWENQDQAFTDVAKGIRKAVEELKLNAARQQLKKLLKENPTLSSEVRHLPETAEQAESGNSISSVSSEPSQEPAAQGGTQIAQNMHLQAIYNRSNKGLRVVIPRLRDVNGNDPVLTSADTSRITMMTAVEGLAYGWLLKALSPMMRANQKIECLLPSPEQVSFIEGSATFLIGSPSTNEQIRRIIASWYRPYMTTEATQDYSDIITYRQKEYQTQFVNEERSRDFSFLGYYSKWFEGFVCTGTSPFGAAGAVSMVVEPHGGQKVETIHEYINNRQSFVAIGEVKILSKTEWAFERVTELEILNDG